MNDLHLSQQGRYYALVPTTVRLRYLTHQWVGLRHPAIHQSVGLFVMFIFRTAYFIPVSDHRTTTSL